MNNITIFGRLTDNPEVKATNDNKAISKFSLADNHGSGQDTKASFFRCTAFGKTAELINNSCQKGHRLIVNGRMEEEKWTDNQGAQKTGWNCIVSTMNFVEAAPTGGQSPQSGPPQYNQPPQYNNHPPQQGYGAPPQQQYGAPPTAQQYQQQGAYAPPPQQAPGGYQQPPVQQGYQQQQPPQNYGAPQQGYTAQPQQQAPWAPQQPQQQGQTGQTQYPPGWDPNKDVPF